MKSIRKIYFSINHSTRMLIWFLLALEHGIIAGIGVSMEQPQLMWLVYGIFVVALVFALCGVIEVNRPYYERSKT